MISLPHYKFTSRLRRKCTSTSSKDSFGRHWGMHPTARQQPILNCSSSARQTPFEENKNKNKKWSRKSKMKTYKTFLDNYLNLFILIFMSWHSFNGFCCCFFPFIPNYFIFSSTSSLLQFSPFVSESAAVWIDFGINVSLMWSEWHHKDRLCARDSCMRTTSA